MNHEMLESYPIFYIIFIKFHFYFFITLLYFQLNCTVGDSLVSPQFNFKGKQNFVYRHHNADIL